MKHPVSNLRSVDELASFLGITTAQLNFYLFKLTPIEQYKTFHIRKRNGGNRTLSSPIKPIRDMQEKLSELLQSSYTPRSHVTAYVKNRGFKYNAAIHQRKRWVGKIDLKDFFPSINFGRVEAMFKAPPYLLPEIVAQRLAHIICYRGSLPQGGITSPIISNMICRGLDHDLRQLAISMKCDFSRYCDDLVFSTNLKEFPIEIIKRGNAEPKAGKDLLDIITENGFEINPEKTRLYSQGVSQYVTGIVVNNGLHVKRSYKKELRAILHRWKKDGLESAFNYYYNHSFQRSRWHEGLRENTFTLSILSKIMHVGFVESQNSKTFKNLLKKYSEVDPNGIKLLNKILSRKPTTITLYTEGQTDRHIIEKAFEVLQASVPIGDIQIAYHHSVNPGYEGLFQIAANLSTVHQRNITVVLFDRDIPASRHADVDSGTGFRHIGNNVYNAFLPRLPGLADEDTCIETYFPLPQLLMPDGEGRRFYRRDEFDDEGIGHDKLFCYSKPRSKKLLCDSNSGKINNYKDKGDKKNYLLSKSAFATYVKNSVPPFDEMDFGNLSQLFQLFQQIKSHHFTIRTHLDQ